MDFKLDDADIEFAIAVSLISFIIFCIMIKTNSHFDRVKFAGVKAPELVRQTLKTTPQKQALQLPLCC